MPRIVSTVDIRVLGVIGTINGMSVFYSKILAGIYRAVRVTADKIKKKAASAVKRGKYKAYRSGDLSRSHRVKITRRDYDGSDAEVINWRPYSIFVHNGTRRIKKNPWLRAMMLDEEERFVKRIKKVFTDSERVNFSTDILNRSMTLQSGRTVSANINKVSFNSEF